MRHERARSTLAALPRTPDDVFSFRNLYRAAKVCSKGTLWKSGAMKFDRHRAVNCARLRESLLTGRFRRQPPVRFTLCERGKVRHIVGPRYRDRIVQRCLCDVFLVPAVSRSLVYSNAASLKGKGTSFARKRFERDLLAARCRYGADARVFQYDVHNYFGSVPSERAFDLISSAVRSLLSAPDETSGVTGLLEVAELYVCEAPYLTLGNQVNQLAAIAYLNGLDHAFHERLELDGAGRYMDDGYVFCPVEVLDDVRCLFRDSLAAAGLTPNRKACFGSDLDRELTFLKVRYYLDGDSPRRRLAQVTLIRYRRHLKSLRRSASAGKLPESVIDASMASFKGVLSVSTARHASNFRSRVLG